MIKKLQVIVREVYESEVIEKEITHAKTLEVIDTWDFKKLNDSEKSEYSVREVPTGKVKLEVSEDDPIYGQVFTEGDLNVKELILHLNRTK